MNNVTIFLVDELDGSMTEWVKVEDGNGGSVCMAKSFYDAQQAAQAQPQA